MILAIILLVASVLGLALSVYFLLLYYRVIEPESERVPSMCRLGQGTCQSVVFSRDGSLLGIPNSIPGIAFYLLLGGFAISRLATGAFHGLDLTLGAALLAVAVGIYLVWALLVKLKTPCVL